MPEQSNGWISKQVSSAKNSLKNIPAERKKNANFSGTDNLRYVCAQKESVPKKPNY